MKKSILIACGCAIALTGAAQADTIWGIDNGADTLGTFDSATPGVFNPIGATGIVSGFVNCIEFDGSGNLWASDGVSLYSVDTGSGAGSLVGTHGFTDGGTAGDFSWDGSDMYTISTVCGAGSQLWTVDLGSGATTNVCTSMLAGSCDVGLTFGTGGDMFAHDLVSDSIYSIDGSCGTSTVVVLPFDSNFGQGLTSGSENYHVAFNSTAFAGELYSFDGSGNYNFLGTLLPLQIAGADVEGGAGDCLDMDVSNLVAGLSAVWDVSGATPGEQVAIVYGFGAGSTVVSGTFGYCATFGIRGVNASQVICRKNADGSGNVSCKKSIPSGTSGRTVLTQAAERNTCKDECVSNLDTQVIA